MAKGLSLHKSSKADTTALSNAFIDKYMIEANGEYVKIYIYLLRSVGTDTPELSLSSIADTFDHTEKDVRRALKYWAKKGLIRLTLSDSKELTGIYFLDIPADNAEEQIATAKEEPIKKPVSVSGSKIQSLSSGRIKRLKDKKDIKQLFFIAEQYLGKTLSTSEINSILYFYDELKFPVDLIEYLIEYCVSKGHKSIHYMNQVALSWSEGQISSVSQAKEISNTYHKNCFSILKAFGITGRNPAAAEIKYINKWMNEYDFTLDIVLEACNRTVLSINKPDFKYANSILENWKAAGVKHLSDIAPLDIKHLESTAHKEYVSPKKAVSVNDFNNFESRSYDYALLEKELIGK